MRCNYQAKFELNTEHVICVSAAHCWSVIFSEPPEHIICKRRTEAAADILIRFWSRHF